MTDTTTTSSPMTSDEVAAIAAIGLPADLITQPCVDLFEEIWRGESTGMNEPWFQRTLADNRQMRRDLSDKIVPPRLIIGTGYRGDTRKLANDYLDKVERGLLQAIATRGRSWSVNIGNVRHAARNLTAQHHG